MFVGGILGIQCADPFFDFRQQLGGLVRGQFAPGLDAVVLGGRLEQLQQRRRFGLGDGLALEQWPALGD